MCRLPIHRSQNNPKMTAFFSNNFNEDRWRKAALKNAFSLLGKQRFQHSAAFFLLAGSLKDAVEVKQFPRASVFSLLTVSGTLGKSIPLYLGGRLIDMQLTC